MAPWAGGGRVGRRGKRQRRAARERRPWMAAASHEHGRARVPPGASPGWRPGRVVAGWGGEGSASDEPHVSGGHGWPQRAMSTDERGYRRVRRQDGALGGWWPGGAAREAPATSRT